MRIRVIVPFVFVALVAGTLAVAPASGATPVVPMVGEYVLSDAEKQYALVHMTPGERDQIGHWFERGAPGLIVGYGRREYEVIERWDGSAILEPVGFVDDDVTAFSVPSTAVAANVQGGKPGTNLLHSFTLIKTRSTSPYEWLVENYVQWPWNYQGVTFDWAEDHLAAAWAGDLYIDRSAGWGAYWGELQSDPLIPMGIYQNDGVPNTGLSYAFNDLNYCGFYCVRHFYWALERVWIRETTWKGRTDNAMVKYVHTYGGINVDLSFSKTPSIGVSGTTEKWSTNLTLSFAH